MNVKDLIARLTDLRETLADGGKSIYQKVLAVFDFLIYLRPALPTAGPAVMGAAAANNPWRASMRCWRRARRSRRIRSSGRRWSRPTAS